jgi:hypothetical protein
MKTLLTTQFLFFYIHNMHLYACCLANQRTSGLTGQEFASVQAQTIGAAAPLLLSLSPEEVHLLHIIAEGAESVVWSAR